jgi:hypothetical protein
MAGALLGKNDLSLQWFLELANSNLFSPDPRWSWEY